MKNNNNDSADNGRRTLLNRMWLGLGALALLQFGWIGSRIFSTDKKQGLQGKNEEQLTIGSLKDFPLKSVTAVPRARLYLARLENGSFLALSPTCTHLGCTISWEEKENMFVCPCHGSTFNILGEPLTSPATRPLDFYPVRLENGLVKVNLEERQKRSGFNPSQTTVV